MLSPTDILNHGAWESQSEQTMFHLLNELENQMIFEWPQEILNMFPAVFMFYRINKLKKTANRNQNYVASVCILDPNELGTAIRTLKHKGYPKLVWYTDPTAKYLANASGSRYALYFHRNFSQAFISLEDYNNPISDMLDKQYPSFAKGQLRLL